MEHIPINLNNTKYDCNPNSRTANRWGIIKYPLALSIKTTYLHNKKEENLPPPIAF